MDMDNDLQEMLSNVAEGSTGDPEEVLAYLQFDEDVPDPSTFSKESQDHRLSQLRQAQAEQSARVPRKPCPYEGRLGASAMASFVATSTTP